MFRFRRQSEEQRGEELADNQGEKVFWHLDEDILSLKDRIVHRATLPSNPKIQYAVSRRHIPN
jgi:hypothetical protein